ncbi:hypothetical protein [Methylobacterium komagatae]
MPGLPFGFGGLLGGGPVPDVQMPDGLPVAGGKGSPLVDAYLALQGQRIKDAVTAPRDAYMGELQMLGPDGHPTTEAMDRANGMAGLAMTGSAPFSIAAARPGVRGAVGVANNTVSPAETLVSRAPPMYDPVARAARPFEADYPAERWPDGPPVDTSGRLTRDIEGRPLHPGARIVGRSSLGGADEALSPAELDAIATAALGKGPESAPRGAIPGRGVGAYQRSRGVDGDERAIFVDQGLSANAKDRVLAHEFGHAVDDMAGQPVAGRLRGAIPQTGISKELGQLYNETNNDLFRSALDRRGDIDAARAEGVNRRNFTPEAAGYAKAQAPDELMAEAVRAYLADPNALKAAYPKTAARIRGAVNGNPALSPLIKFNAGGPAGAVAGLPALAASSDPKGSPMSAGPSPFGLGPMSDEIGQRLRLSPSLGVATGFPQAPEIAWPSQVQAIAQKAPPSAPSASVTSADGEADTPVPSAIPAQGQAPLSLAPPPSPAAPATSSQDQPSDGFDFGGALDRFRKNGGFDTLGNIGIGLMSTHGFGNGLAAGLKLDQDTQAKRAVTDLAKAEFGLKTRKLAQEQGALTGNAAILKKAYPTLSDQEALAQGSNGSAVTEALKILRDPNHGRENDPEVIRARAQAQAEGTAAGGKDDVQLVTRPDGSVVAVNKSQIGAAGGTPTVTPVMAGTSKLAAEADERRQLVVAQGKDPSDPRYADYIVSGSLPKETQQLLTAADKKAVMDGEDTILSHKNTITQLNRALELSKKAYDGAGAGARSLVVSNIPEMLGGHTPESLATREFSNVVTGQALDNLKATFGGAPTEGERAILLQVQGSADQPQALREQILKNAMAKVQQKLDFEQQRVDQLRGGTYYKQGGGAASSTGEPPAPGAPTTGAKRMRYDPKTGGFN